MSKIKIVLDSNVLVSAALFKGSIGRKAFQKATTVGQIVVSEPTLAEIKDVFSRPRFNKYLSPKLRTEFLQAFEASAEIVDIYKTVEICRDPKDNKFLNLALNSQAKLLISGDKDLLVLTPFRGTKIVSPASYCAET